MTQGTWVLVVAVAVAVLFGGYRAWSDGRFRNSPAPVDGSTPEIDGASRADSAPDGAPSTPSVLADTAYAAQLGDSATLLQFSSAFCAPCRATRQILAGVAAGSTGVAHVEIDAEHHLELVRRLGIARTPTTLVLDRRGREVGRAAGAPRREQVLAALAVAERGPT